MNSPLELTLISGSMEPTIKIGDKVYCVQNRRFSPGDVVVFNKNGIYLVHRIISRFPPPFNNWILQKGDRDSLSKLENINSIIGIVIFPDISSTSSKKQQTFENIRWGFHLLKGIVSKSRFWK
jgi:signal peptidase I